MSETNVWHCEKCGEKSKRLQIAWGTSSGMKVDVLDFWCPKCGNPGYKEGPKLTYSGNTQEYWDKEWDGIFEEV